MIAGVPAHRTEHGACVLAHAGASAQHAGQHCTAKAHSALSAPPVYLLCAGQLCSTCAWCLTQAWSCSQTCWTTEHADLVMRRTTHRPGLAHRPAAVAGQQLGVHYDTTPIHTCSRELSASNCVCSVGTVPRKPLSLVSLTSSPMENTCRGMAWRARTLWHTVPFAPLLMDGRQGSGMVWHGCSAEGARVCVRTGHTSQPSGVKHTESATRVSLRVKTTQVSHKSQPSGESHTSQPLGDSHTRQPQKSTC